MKGIVGYPIKALLLLYLIISLYVFVEKLLVILDAREILLLSLLCLINYAVVGVFKSLFVGLFQTFDSQLLLSFFYHFVQNLLPLFNLDLEKVLLRRHLDPAPTLLLLNVIIVQSAFVRGNGQFFRNIVSLPLFFFNSFLANKADRKCAFVDTDEDTLGVDPHLASVVFRRGSSHFSSFGFFFHFCVFSSLHGLLFIDFGKLYLGGEVEQRSGRHN